MQKAVVIGAGLGGLETAAMLARMGYKVLVLEKEPKTGGALQSFRRGDTTFDSGFHYVGGLNPGGSLRPLFSYFGLMDLPWRQMDPEAADIVMIGEHKYCLPQGHDHFVEALSEQFPDQRENLKAYVSLLREVGDHIFDSLNGPSPYFSQSAYDWLCRTITDPELRRVLSGASLKLQLDAETLPLYIFAQINNSFIQSSWRLEGGGDMLCNRLRELIEQYGGEVRTSARVTKIIEAEGTVTGVEVNSSEFVPADYVVCDLHPACMVSLLAESKAIRRIYRNRVNSVPNSYGMFTVNCRLKPDTVPYRNSNVNIYSPEADLWHYRPGTIDRALVSFYPTENKYAQSIDLLTPMAFSEVEPWKDSEFGARPDEYKQMKQARAEQLIDFVSKRMPELSGNIDRYYTSTPLTYLHYTGTPFGSAYGIMKDWRSPMTTLWTPLTPVHNLILTGQNLNLHGILGVSMTTLFTVAAIAGFDRLNEQLDTVLNQSRV